MPIQRVIPFIDTALGESGGCYFLGEKVSLVDIAYIPFFERMDVALPAFKDFEIRSLTLPHLNAWLEAMSNRESYQKTCLKPERIKELYSRFLAWTSSSAWELLVGAIAPRIKAMRSI